MRGRQITPLTVIFAIALPVFLLSCQTQRVSRELIAVEHAKNMQAKYLKAHINDGSLYLLTTWNINDQQKIISATGDLYDPNRRLVRAGKFVIPFDDIQVLETNDPSTNPGVATMVVMGLATIPMSIYCLVQPKACFGSCPTFYVQSDNKEVLFGEGFSSSICKALEETDVDLINLPIDQQPARITVKNEALETHVIQYVNLLAFDKKPEERIIQSNDGDYYKIDSLQNPSSATYNDQSIHELLARKDYQEWFSLADSSDLLTKEEIELEFKNSDQPSGLVIDQRQSLMTTFLFYHSLSVTGLATGFFLAEIENGNELLKKRLQRFYEILGGVEVLVLTDQNSWTKAGEIQEAGPIVSDIHFIRLPKVNTPTIKVKLRMTKGLWRIDMVNAANIVSRVVPERIMPTQVYRSNIADSVTLRKLLSDEYVVTYPGDVFTIHYPEVFDPGKEYFIESRGYYLEWLREDWLKHQDIELAQKMFMNPRKYLKKMTPAYKAIEPEMEEVFWKSRYTNHHEN